MRPLKKAIAKEVVEYFEKDVFHVFGVPENSVQYRSKEFAALHSTKGQSPYYTLFGYQMVQHGAMDVETWIVPHQTFKELLHADTQQNLQAAHKRHEAVYNSRSRDVTNQPGQEVFRRSFKLRGARGEKDRECISWKEWEVKNQLFPTMPKTSDSN